MEMEFDEDENFTKKAANLITDDEQRELEITLINNPAAGVEIGGGLRKIRLPGKGRGKSGGHRMIYFWFVQKKHIRFLDIFTKNKKENISKTEQQILIKKSK